MRPRSMPPVVVNVTEGVGVSDSTSVMPPVVVNVTEGVGVSDATSVCPRWW